MDIIALFSRLVFTLRKSLFAILLLANAFTSEWVMALLNVPSGRGKAKRDTKLNPIFFSQDFAELCLGIKFIYRL